MSNEESIVYGRHNNSKIRQHKCVCDITVLFCSMFLAMSGNN
jgi:hypothetical protein